MSKKNKIDVSQLVFRLSLVLVIFIMGGILALGGFYPFKFLENGYKATKSFVEEKTRKRPVLLMKSIYKGKGVTLNDPSQTHKALTLMQGLFPGGPQARLIDMDGKIVHSWKIDFFKIWPNPKHIFPHKNVPKTQFNYHTQGIVALPDGSIVANIGNKGTVKLGKCNQVIWTVDRMTHHSVTLTDEGGFWIPANKDLRKVAKDLFFYGMSYEKLKKGDGRYENLILYVDANGQVQKEFSVLQAIVDAGMEHQLHDAMIIRETAPTHVNDIEVVTSELAAKIDEVNEGDLLVSIRQFHMLNIFDKDSGKIKWTQEGPWVRQHDPDITPEGKIVVFNNRSEGVSIIQEPGSNIIEFDPATHGYKILYPGPKQGRFYSDILGTHQSLANGNRLINESRAGRVFEINPNGDIVWEFVQPYDKKYAALVEVADRYEYDYFTVDDWSCPKN
jgi:hypothetical protein